MKKITLLLFALLSITLSSCSNDDDTNPEDGYMKVLSLGYGSAPGDPIIYYVNYGTALGDDEVYTEVSEEVFNYYSPKFIDLSPKKPRWRGMINQDPD